MSIAHHTAADIKIHTKEGIVLNEKSYVALSKATNKIIAVGNEAAKLLEENTYGGYTKQGDIEVVSPLKQGYIVDYVVALPMFKYFFQKTHKIGLFQKPKVTVAIPFHISAIETRVLEDILVSVGCKEGRIVAGPDVMKHIDKLLEGFTMVLEIAKDEPEDYVRERVEELIAFGKMYGVSKEKLSKML